jgi:hypothetical protein
VTTAKERDTSICPRSALVIAIAATPGVSSVRTRGGVLTAGNEGLGPEVCSPADAIDRSDPSVDEQDRAPSPTPAGKLTVARCPG